MGKCQGGWILLLPTVGFKIGPTFYNNYEGLSKHTSYFHIFSWTKCQFLSHLLMVCRWKSLHFTTLTFSNKFKIKTFLLWIAKKHDALKYRANSTIFMKCGHFHFPFLALYWRSMINQLSNQQSVVFQSWVWLVIFMSQWSISYFLSKPIFHQPIAPFFIVQFVMNAFHSNLSDR